MHQYDFSVNATNYTKPFITVNTTSKLEVATGIEITSLAIDDDQSILYIADGGEEQISRLKYAPEMLTMIKSEKGLEEALYEGLHNFEYVYSIAVDRLGGIYWSFSEYGKEDGVIHKASADRPSEDSIEQESKALEEASSLFYSGEFLFFISADNNKENATSTSAVYYKNVPRTGEVTGVVNRVIGGFEDLVSVVTLDEFIYVADSTVGIFAIESYRDGTFSEPRPITLKTGDAEDSVAPMPTTMVIFALGGLQGLYFSLSILVCLCALDLF